MTLEHELVELAHSSPPAEIHAATLDLLRAAFDADLGILAGQDRGREVRQFSNLDTSAQHLIEDNWERSKRDLLPVKAEAARAGGAAIDRRVLGSSLERTSLYRRVMAPLGGCETLLLVTHTRGRPLALFALGRRRAFSNAASAEASRLVPVLSLVCRVAHDHASTAWLTAAENDLLDYLELGHATEAIARARGTSFFTVRNQLATLYKKLGVSNRAEAIGRRYRQ